jgi:uncharacterized protein GlcG (DUF336 family)
MSSLTLAQTNAIIAAALAKGRELRLAPITVVVLDAGGHMIAMQREDRSGILRPQIAGGKAWRALGMRIGTRELWERSSRTPVFFGAIAAASEGRMVPVPGGVLVLNAAGEVVGAVGISGDVSDKDEECALAGIGAAGLKAATGVPGGGGGGA